jgi:flagellar basal-body rod modification protein FlgD
MATSSVSSAGSSTSNLSPEIQKALSGITIKSNKNTLTQDDFLHLLTVQLQNQDPLKPMEDAQFMGQMAQFAALEQTKELNTTMTNLGQSLTLTSAQQFLGMKITVNDNGTMITGLCSSVKQVNGATQVVVNGTPYTTDKIAEVAYAQSASGAVAQ